MAVKVTIEQQDGTWFSGPSIVSAVSREIDRDWYSDMGEAIAGALLMSMPTSPVDCIEALIEAAFAIKNMVERNDAPLPSELVGFFEASEKLMQEYYNA